MTPLEIRAMLCRRPRLRNLIALVIDTRYAVSGFWEM